MHRWVEITFDCLPLRTITRLDIPIDASPQYRQRCENIKAAIQKHGTHNSYYLYNAHCIYHLVNCDKTGAIDFLVEGTLLTDAKDKRCQHCDLSVTLASETCDWLSEPITKWFAETVSYSMKAEFDRYVQAGDLDQTRKRIEQMEAASDEAGGFVGMYL